MLLHVKLFSLHPAPPQVLSSFSPGLLFLLKLSGKEEGSC